MAKRKPAPGNRGERPVCRLCDRPATQLAHSEYKSLNHKYLKEIRQPAMLRRFPEHAVCDSHLDSYNEVSSINAGWIPDPKSEFKCDLCGKTMQHRDKSEHDSLHQLGFEAHSLKLKSDIEKNVENLRNALDKRFKEHEDRLNTLRNLRMKLTHSQDNIEAVLEEEIRRDDPKTGENYDEHY